MTKANFCSNCGAHIETGDSFCKQCGHKIENDSIPSPKSASTALLLCLFLGSLGVHRFYVGKIGTGILMLLTGGGLGIWYLIDIILIANCQFTDAQGNLLIFTRGKGSTLKRTISVVALVIAGFLIYLTALISIVLYATSGISSTVKEELAAIRSGNYEKAYSYTSKEFKDSTSLEEFKNSINKIPSLKNNQSVTITERKIENDSGAVNATLKSKDGVSSLVEFRLRKEGKTWKILEIHVLPQTDGMKHETNEYTNKENKFSIKYPDNWIHKQSNSDANAFFKKQENTSQPNSVVSIRAIHPANNIVRISPHKYIEAIKNKVGKELSNFTVLSQNEIELPQNPSRFKGEALIFSFTKGDSTIKQMFIIMLRDDNNTFYTFSYTAPIQQYDKDLPTVKSMFESWIIY